MKIDIIDACIMIVKKQSATIHLCLCFFFVSATLIFNPLAYAIEKGVGWRITYSIYAILLFVVGSAITATFRPKTKESDDLIVSMTSFPGGGGGGY